MDKKTMVERFHRKLDKPLSSHMLKRIIGKKFEDGWITIVTTIENVQVLRYFKIYGYMSSDKKTNCRYINEKFQHFIFQDGTMMCYSKRKVMYGFAMSGEWKFVDPKTRYAYSENIFYSRISDYVRRIGVSAKKYDIDLSIIIRLAMSSPHIQTLLKRDKVRFLYSPELVEKFWVQVRMCLRQNYYPKSMSMFYDTLSLSENLGIDIRNSRNVIFRGREREEHNRLYRLSRRKMRIESNVLASKDPNFTDEDYIADKGNLLNIRISYNGIEIAPLQRIKDFLNEGLEMNHCICQCKYFKRKESLIFSARYLNGKRISTIEYSLDQRRVVQNRGVNNETPEHYELTNRLVNEIMSKHLNNG